MSSHDFDQRARSVQLADVSTIAKVPVGDFDVRANGDGLLVWWNSLRGDGSLDKVSGIGRYTTNVDVPASGWDGAHLDLGEVHGAARVLVNGQHLLLDLQDTAVDLGQALHPGSNTVEIIVASTLNNAANGTDLQNYGLRGPVTLTPYDEHIVIDASQDPDTPGTPIPTPTPTPTPTFEKATARIATKMVKPVEVGAKARLRITVRAKGVVPSGAVKIVVKGPRKKKSYARTLNVRGRTKVLLPRFKRPGQVRVKIKYLGDTFVESKHKKIAFAVVDRRTVR